MWEPDRADLCTGPQPEQTVWCTPVYQVTWWMRPPCVIAESWAIASSQHTVTHRDPMYLVQLTGASQVWQQAYGSIWWWNPTWWDLLIPWYATVLSAVPARCSRTISSKEWHLCCCSQALSQFFSKQGWKCILWCTQFLNVVLLVIVRYFQIKTGLKSNTEELQAAEFFYEKSKVQLWLSFEISFLGKQWLSKLISMQSHWWLLFLLPSKSGLCLV